MPARDLCGPTEAFVRNMMPPPCWSCPQGQVVFPILVWCVLDFVLIPRRISADKMSSRISKQKKSDSARERAQKSEYILAHGFEVVPCTRCVEKGVSCLIIPNLNRCATCIRLGRSCDSVRASMSSSECSPWGLFVPADLLRSSSRENQQGIVALGG